MCFDGVRFAAKAENALGFRSAREAIERIQAEKWFHTELVVDFGDDSQVRVSGYCFEAPNEVVLGVARCRAENANTRFLKQRKAQGFRGMVTGMKG